MSLSEEQVDSDGRAVFEVGLGALAWCSLLNAVEGCRNIVLDLEAPPLFFYAFHTYWGKVSSFGCIWSSRHWELNDVALGVEECYLIITFPRGAVLATTWQKPGRMKGGGLVFGVI